MKVGLIHKGGALPNIALMRLSAYHKMLGDDVMLDPTPLDGCDKVYISTLFTWRRKEIEALAAQFRAVGDVMVGGSGWDLQLTLPPEVDLMMNDYDLYGIDYGMGYSSRGCIRKCAFCPVPKTEGGIREAASIRTLLNPRSNKLMLMDNNFFASDWKPKVEEVKRRGLVVDWPQGNDIRLMTPEIAAALSDLHRNRHIGSGQFKQIPGRLHFAWDLPSNDARTEDVVAGARLLLNAGFKPDDLTFYVLIGYPGYSIDEELHRITTLHSLDIEPYVMVYRDFGIKDNRDPVRKAIQRWNNAHFWHKVPFAEFNPKRHVDYSAKFLGAPVLPGFEAPLRCPICGQQDVPESPATATGEKRQRRLKGGYWGRGSTEVTESQVRCGACAHLWWATL